MDPMVIMALVSILGTVIGTISSQGQQNKEFNQQQNLLNQEQDFAREREDLAYERSKPQQQMQNMLAAGFNPNLAANAVLGGNGQSVSAIGSPGAPNVNSAIGALQSMIGQGSQNLYDIYLKQLQAKNIEANTNKTNVEAGLMPRDFELRRMSTEAQIRVWDKSVEKMASEIGLNEEETNLVKQQNLYYGRKSEAEISVYEKQAAKMVEEAKLIKAQTTTEAYKQEELKARAELEGQEVFTEQAKQQNLSSLSNLYDAETSGQILENKGKTIDLNFVQEHDLPLTIDGQKYLTGLLNKGEFDKASTFMQAIFQSALNQEYGSNIGKTSLDFNFMGNRLHDARNIPSGYSHIPFWNPQ